MRKLFLTLFVLLTLLLLPSRSHAQYVVVGQACGAGGLSAIANDGTPVICRGNPLVWTGTGGGGGGINSGAYQNAFYVGPKCPVGNANQCYNAFFDTQYAFTVTCNNTSTTITTGANDPPFIFTDVGKAIAGVNTLGLQAANCPPQGVITTFNNAHSVVVSNAATATTTTGSLGWGHNDGAQIAAAYAASLGVGCLFLSDGGAFFDVPPFLDTRAATAVGTPPCVIGTGNTRLTPLPAFNYASCQAGTLACFFAWPNGTNMNPNYALLKDFEFLGLGYNLTGSGGGDNLITWTRTTIENVWLWNIGGSVGVGFSGSGPTSVFSSINQQSGATACQVTGTGGTSAGMNQIVTIEQGYCAGLGSSSLVVGTNAALKTKGMQFGSPTSGPNITVSGVWDSWGDGFSPGAGTNDTIRIGTNGFVNLNDDWVIGGTNNTFGAVDCNASGATVNLQNTNIDGGSGGVAIRSVSGCNVRNNGNNKVIQGTLSLSGNNFAVASETQTGTCSTNAATVTFKLSYVAAPLVLVSDSTSASTGAQVTATSTTTATVHCNGASDTFTATVYPNPI